MKNKVREKIKAKEIKELEKLVEESESLIFKLRFEKAQNKLKNLRQIFNERKKIAFAKTLITQKLKLEETLKKKDESVRERKQSKTKYDR